MIHRTESISFPRSGHGALYHVLRRYFGDDFHYCAPLSPHNCGCNSVPCTRSRTNFSKNHDFGAYKGDGIPIRPDQRYLIQYRNPVRSIISNYRVFLEQNPHRDSRKEWYFFAHQWLVFWNRLIDKWVLAPQVQVRDQMMLPYEKLVTEPEASTAEVIVFMTGAPPDQPRLDAALSDVGVKPLNRHADFQFHDPGFFHKLEELAAPRLDALSVPRFADSA